jgi:hypothetical protein
MAWYIFPNVFRSSSLCLRLVLRFVDGLLVRLVGKPGLSGRFSPLSNALSDFRQLEVLKDRFKYGSECSVETGKPDRPEHKADIHHVFSGFSYILLSC